MKSYKLVNSKEVQEKAFRLGYKPFSSTSRDNVPFLFCDNDGVWSTGNILDFNRTDNQEITQKDFLLLPEPLKVGDWVKYIDEDQAIIILNIKSLINDFSFVATTERTYHDVIKYCTKLTKEQMIVMGLE